MAAQKPAHIRICFTVDRIISQGPGFVEISTDSSQSPKLPAFIFAVNSAGTTTSARYITVSAKRGSLKMGEERR